MIAPARRAAYAALLDVASGRRHLDDAVESARTRLDDPRDVALLHELTTGAVRWQSQLDFLLEPLCSVPLTRLDPEVLTAMRLGAYQLQFLNRVPASAVVHDSVALVRAARKSSAAGMANAVLRRLANGERRPLPERPTVRLGANVDVWVDYLSILHAHPAWLVARWLSRESIDVVERWLQFNNALPLATVRANPLVQPDRDALARALDGDGVETAPCRYAPLGLTVTAGSIRQSSALKTGSCVVQDEGSQLAGRLAPVFEGARVLDLCAAPGGKALQYAAATGLTGFVVACDVRPRRLRVLREALHRGCATRSAVVHIDEHGPLPFRPEFDVVAVDAPCSGLGTLRRDPDIKWRRSPADIGRYADRQLELLERAARCVGDTGALVYTTCSSEPEENEGVVARFLTSTSGFRRRVPDPSMRPFLTDDGFVTLRPVDHGLECYFGAVLERDSRERRLAGAVPDLVIQ